ncbi:MAG: tetratricopeptide repeat protein [Microcoleaceae cyanobacterium]
MVWYEEAIYSINQGDFTTAISLCQQILSQQPNQILAYKIWGKVLQKQADYQAAIECYSQALNIQPDDSEIYLELGNIYTKQQQWQDAIISYQVVIRLQPELSIAYRSLGQCLIQLERWEAVVEVYRKLIQLSPQVSWFYNHLGKALMRLNRWQEASHAYQTSVDLNPSFCWTYYHLGQCLIQLKQWQKAENILKKGIKINSNHILLHEALSNILQQQNKDFEAIQIYQDVIKLKPCSTYYISIGKLFKKQQQLDKAAEAFIQALHFQSNCYELFVLLGDILKQQGFLQESLQCRNLIKIPIFWIKQYFNLTPNYTTTTDSDSNIQRNIIYPTSILELYSPKTLDNFLPAGFEIRQNNIPEVFISILKNGRIWSDSLTNTVITSKNRIISDLSNGCPELILCSEHLPCPIQLEGNVAFLSVQFGLVYYHWMLDLLPRIALLKQQRLYKNIDYFVVNRYQTAYEKSTLDIIGIPQDKIIESVQFPHIKASNLIIPSPIQTSLTPQPWTIQYLRQYFISDFSYNLPDSSRIYISRIQAKKRNIHNEETIINLLKTYGFEILDFECISIDKQVKIMANAEVVIAPHGSGLTNLVFCQPGTKVIEILSPSWLNYCYWMLSQACQLDYFYLAGESSIANPSKPAQYQDYYVNIKKLQQLMKLAEVI